MYIQKNGKIYKEIDIKSLEKDELIDIIKSLNSPSTEYYTGPINAIGYGSTRIGNCDTVLSYTDGNIN